MAFNFTIKSEIRNPISLGRGARVAELAALEMLCTGNRTVGSNPTLSASKKISNCGFRISNLKTTQRNPH